MMLNNTATPTPLLGSPLKVVVLGSQAFAEALEAQHTPVILIDSQLSDEDGNPGE